MKEIIIKEASILGFLSKNVLCLTTDEDRWESPAFMLDNMGPGNRVFPISEDGPRLVSRVGSMLMERDKALMLGIGMPPSGVEKGVKVVFQFVDKTKSTNSPLQIHIAFDVMYYDDFSVMLTNKQLTSPQGMAVSPNLVIQ